MKASEIATRLGFAPDAKMLIIHCDDVGMSWGANQAVKALLTKGVPKSASIMFPCPWAFDFTVWAKQNPGLDIGVHATLNSEWETYRWRPLTPKQDAPGLFDQAGFMHRSVQETAARASAEEVYNEICRQIEQALAWGITPTHIDTHMGTVFARFDYAQAYIEAAKKYNILPMLIDPSPAVISMVENSGYPKEIIGLLEEAPTPKLTAILGAANGKTYEEKKAAIYAQLERIPTGLSYFIIHPNLYTADMPDVTDSWQERHWEYAIFMEEQTRKKLEELEIKIVTWQQIAEVARS